MIAFVSPAGKMCTNKRVYTTLVAAYRKAIKRHQRVYLCPRCNFWHLTSKNVDQLNGETHDGQKEAH